MNFSKNLKAFLKGLPLKDLNGHQMFLAIAAHCSSGDKSREICVSDVRGRWPKALLKMAYNPVFYNRAQEQGWVDPISTQQGAFLINDDGMQYLYAMFNSEPNARLSTNGGLYIFEKKNTHSFDKFLRGVFTKTKSKVLVADSWVDETIFDNVLDSIPKTHEVKLIYGQKRGTFDSRVVRFTKEYSKFVTKKYNDLHDRFLIVDEVGYILGPSIKDAASNSPALVVVLDKKDSSALANFFQNLWKNAK